MRRSLGAAFTVALLAFATHAHADDAANREGRARFKEGVALADASNYEGARLKFLQAFAMLKAPAILFNLASMEQKTGRDVEAIEHYRAFLKGSESDAHITDATREKARKEIAELASKVAQIEIDAPDGARISIDGKPLETTPSDLVAVTPGKHRVEATLAGRVRAVSVDAVVGQVAKANVAFDGAPSEATPAPAPDSTAANVQAPEARPASWSTARIVTVGALAAGAVTGGVLALVFRAEAGDSVDDAKQLLQGGSCVGVDSPPCSRARELKSAHDTDVTLSTVSLIAGGALAAGAVVSALVWPTSIERSARVSPVAAPGYGGISFVGRF